MSFQLKTKIIASLSALAVLSCAPAQKTTQETDAQIAAKRVSHMMASWLGYLPGYEKTTLLKSKKGIQLWSLAAQSTVKTVTQNFEATPMGDFSDILGNLPADGGSSGGSSSGGGVSTSPSLGGGASLPTSPSLGSGTTPPAAPVLGSGDSFPVSPSLGASASVRLSPATAGEILAAMGGTASATEFASAFCNYLYGYFVFLGACVSDEISETDMGLGSLNSCASWIGAMIPELATLAVPASVVNALDCVGDALQTASCIGTGVDADVSTPVVNAFSSCGLDIGSSGSSGSDEFLL